MMKESNIQLRKDNKVRTIMTEGHSRQMTRATEMSIYLNTSSIMLYHWGSS